MLFCFGAQAGKIKNAFEALSIYNYFKAKKQFQQLEKKHPSIACFGLSTIYFRNDNPFHQIDSAYVKIVNSIEHFPYLSQKKRKKYTVYQFDSSQLIQLRQQISTALFQRAIVCNTEADFAYFLKRNPWALEVPKAQFFRDSLAFLSAKKQQHSNAFQAFLNKYPQSYFAEAALTYFYQFQYAEQTLKKSAAEYAQFIQNYPNNPYNEDAQDKLFEIVCAPNTIAQFYYFIQQYPNNKNVEKAWRMLYRSYMSDFSEERLLQFEQAYPDFPFKNDLEEDKKLVNQLLLPFVKDSKWGYMNKFGQIIIPPKFDGADYFDNGIAIVSQNDKLGYINKRGEFIVKAQFDEANKFENGFAIVEKGGKYGLIDRLGNYSIPLIYKQIGSIHDGLIFALKDSLYTCINVRNQIIFTGKFDQTNGFSNGRAIVSKHQFWGLIDTTGKVVLPFTFDKITPIYSHYLANKGDSIYLFSAQSDTLLKFINAEISNFSEGYALLIKNDKISILNKEGKIIVQDKFDNYPNATTFGLFKNKHAKMYNAKLDRYGLIDTLGNWTFPPKFKNISFYSPIVAAKKYTFW
jgi:hypothetical protein